MFPVIQKIFLDLSNFYVPDYAVDTARDLINSSINKVQEAFLGSNVEFVLEKPVNGNYSTLDLNSIMNNNDSYLGIANFDQSFDPNDNGRIRMDNVLQNALNNNLPLEKASNLVASTIVHETGHLMGLGHVNDPTDIMNDGLTDNMWENPPRFTAQQLQSINTNAIIANVSENDNDSDTGDDKLYPEDPSYDSDIALSDLGSIEGQDIDDDLDLEEVDEFDIDDLI